MENGEHVLSFVFLEATRSTSRFFGDILIRTGRVFIILLRYCGSMTVYSITFIRG